MPTRRDFLYLSAGAVVATMLPMSFTEGAVADVLPDHPFLGLVREDPWLMYWDLKTPRLVMERAKETVPVQSIAHAEEVFLSEVMKTQITYFRREYDGNLLVHREGNRIAANTRRGKGNVVLVHPDRLDRFSPPEFVAGSGEAAYGWGRAGAIGVQTVWTHEQMPRHICIVLYRGRSPLVTEASREADGPAVIDLSTGRMAFQSGLNKYCHAIAL